MHLDCFVILVSRVIGKTYSAIKFCIDRKLSTDCLIVTNVSSFTLFSDTVFIDNITDLMNYVSNYIDNFYLDHDEDEAPNILIFFDEIFTVLEKQTKISKEIRSFISQLRKRKIIFVTTAQEWLEINMTFRRYVRFQVDCKMFALPISRTAFQLNCINDAEQIKWSDELNDYVSPRIKTKLSKGNKSIIDSYDTFEIIQTNK